MVLQLTKQSTDQEIKAYFEEVLNLSKDSEEFPVNLDDVWSLVYSRKDKAVTALKSNDLFLQDIDYQVFHQNGENSTFSPNSGGGIGRPTNTYMLSVPCLEFFIARKVRSVFEVYRQVFHRVANGVIVPPRPIYSNPCDLEASIKPLSDYADEVYLRWKRLFELSNDSKRVRTDYDNWIVAYRNFCYYTSHLVYLETVAKLDGNQFLK